METTKFVKQLASNNRVVRENALDALQKYMVTKQFKSAKQAQFDKLWKGLYYSMWFSDRPRPQQRLANELSDLYLRYFDEKDNNESQELSLNDKAFIRFSKAFWRVICIEWYGIDRHRIDKYLLLIRRVFFKQLKYLKLREWHEPLVSKYLDRVLQAIPLSGDPKVYNGIPIHIIDILFDEWERLALEGEEEEELEFEEKMEKMTEFTANSPFPKIIAIFEKIRSNYDNSKILREKIKTEVFGDKRMQLWDVIQEEEPKKDEEEEWNGF
ncbi:Ribosomal RNA-processing protein 1 [Nakaseomyces bracarensis]|uniref:Ribosomal RNA-processing protein 1 n=1 Tax=Nakaseomyces bracarensis TaxID=273131 RepID=A0ABR4NZA9_9SACH